MSHASTHADPSDTPDEAAVETVVRSVGLLADRRDFDALAALYAARVELDYTSLAGGTPMVLSGAEIMDQWAATLPGFDQTRHAISGVEVEIDGDAARATAHVVADHWLGGDHWRVEGDYRYRLIRQAEGWRIVAHRLTVTGQAGDLGLGARATQAAKARPADWTRRRQAREVEP
jgi:ketosteroid isomerase-like protein